jgi:sugar phosphate isomerase/epimerase
MNAFLSTPHALSLHHLTALDATPEELIAIAGELRCDHVCLFAHVPEAARHVYPRVGEGDVPAVAEALRKAGVTLCNIEVFPLDSDPDWAGFGKALAVGHALGATRATAHVHDADEAEGARRLARLCDMAAGFGIIVGLEFNGFSAVRTIDRAAAILAATDRANVALVCDMLHLVRSGGGAADVARHRDRIGYLQLSDGPSDIAADLRWHEAIRERMLPGDGAFPLAATLAAIRPGTVIDIEVPQAAARKAGVSARERARRAVMATRRLLPRATSEAQP